MIVILVFPALIYLVLKLKRKGELDFNYLEGYGA